MTNRTPIEAVTNVLARAQNIAESLTALTDLARAARDTADLSRQLH